MRDSIWYFPLFKFLHSGISDDIFYYMFLLSIVKFVFKFHLPITISYLVNIRERGLRSDDIYILMVKWVPVFIQKPIIQ